MDWTVSRFKNPSDTGYYLVTLDSVTIEYNKDNDEATSHNDITIAYYSVVYDEWFAGGVNVLAWMPLPEPYKEAD